MRRCTFQLFRLLPLQLMARLNGYRAGLLPVVPTVGIPAGLRRFQVISTLPLNVRQAPTSKAVSAGKLRPGQIFLVDVIKQGQAVNGVTGWAHMARVPHEQADLGFVSMRWLKEV